MFVVNIMGGLGNQLFQYNFALYLRDKFPAADIRLNTTHFKVDSIHGGYLLEHEAFAISNRRRNRSFTVVDDETFRSGAFSAADNIVFNGYWQDSRFFDKDYVDFARLFGSPRDARNKDWQRLIGQSPSAVSVHVRCGDYNNHFQLGNIATKAYFNNAIKEVLRTVPDAAFFVFSDDSGWAARNLDFGRAPVYFISGNETPRRNKWDIFLMSCCTHHIMSNSSFSWWGQYFDRKPGRTVVTPPYWVNERIKVFPSVVANIQNLPYAKKVANVPLESGEPPARPLISVVLAACNQEDCIHRAVSSVLNQTFRDFELVAVDDGSSDGTAAVLAEFAALSSRLKVIRHAENRSLFMARKSGVQAASGDYILFLDGDDYLFIDALQKLRDEVIAQDDSFDACEFSYMQRPENMLVRPEAYNTEDKRLSYFLRPDATVTIWNKLYKAAPVKEAFAAMGDAYINATEDTYGSSCIAFFTRRFIQRDILVSNYLVGSGISTKEHTLAENQCNFASIHLVLEGLADFMRPRLPEDEARRLLHATEQRLLAWAVSRIEEATVENDRTESYFLLPGCFHRDALVPVISGILQDCRRYRRGAFSPANAFRRLCSIGVRLLSFTKAGRWLCDRLRRLR